MTDLKKQIRAFLLDKGLTEQPTSIGLCYIYRFCKGDWHGKDWAEVRFPDYYETSNRIEVSTGYSGASTGDEGYAIASYKGTSANFKEFLHILEITKFNSQIKKGKNQYIVFADYR